MTDRPILMNAEMVRATLSGSKTQTRRIVKSLPDGIARVAGPWMKQDGTCVDGHDWSFGSGEIKGDSQNFFVDKKMPCPFGIPGDRLWVRESGNLSLDKHAWMYADHGGCLSPLAPRGSESWAREWKGTPSIHMPRWASRITLEVTGVRAERLNDICEVDAKAEGVTAHDMYGPNGFAFAHGCTYKASFANLWESINGPGSWDANPWVWVIEYKRIYGEDAS